MADQKKEKYVGVARGTITIEVECHVLEGSNAEDMLADIGGDIEHWLHDHPHVRSASFGHAEAEDGE
jgi:hypothetical protein